MELITTPASAAWTLCRMAISPVTRWTAMRKPCTLNATLRGAPYTLRTTSSCCPAAWADAGIRRSEVQESLQIQPAQMRLRFGKEPGAAGQPAVSLPPIEILVPISGYKPNFGDGVQVHT